MNSNKLYLALTLKKRLLFFCLTVIVCFFIVSVLVGIITWKFGSSTPAMRIAIVLQNVLLFIIPPVITALLVTRQPATLLAIDRKPTLMVSAAMIAALLVSMPAMNFVIYLNENIPLPQTLRESLQAMEDSAAGTVTAIMGAHDIPNLIVTVLIVGVLTGVSEEMLFRGGLQRLLVTGGMNVHAAIWISAALFSLLHMQFFGFVPRMLLGALFGYALAWSGSLWLPILLHALNNTMFLISEYMSYGQDTESWINEVGRHEDLVAITLSLALTAGALYFAHRQAQVPQN